MWASDGKEKFITRTSGAVLRRSVRIPKNGSRKQRHSHPGNVWRDRRQGCHDGNRNGAHKEIELKKTGVSSRDELSKLRPTLSIEKRHISEMMPTMTQHLKDDFHAIGPMGREHHDPRNGSDIGTGVRRQYSRQFCQGIAWSASGRGILLNPSKERTAGGPFDLDRSESSFTGY